MGIKSRNKVSVEFSMSSMTDIVFLLLIFFIVLSTLVTQNAMNVDLPFSNVKNQGKQSVSVTIAPDYTFYVGSAEVTEDGLESELISQMGDAPDPGIILHADKTVPIKYVMTVMQIAHRNEFSLRMATQAQ